MADALQRPIGTRDFAPAEMAVRHHVAARMRKVFQGFGYREVATPAFEELALFTAKSGPGIVDELYNFKDKGGRDLTLRPELTAPVMRMYFQEHFTDPKPLKWFYFGACYRYDRPQAGRYREFWQFGCEQIGAGTPLAYAELIALGDAVMRAVGLRNREFFVGHVGLLKRLVTGLKFDDSWGVDAIGKDGSEKAVENPRLNFMRLLDKGAISEIEANPGQFFQFKTVSDRQDFEHLMSLLKARHPSELESWLPNAPEIRELVDVFEYMEALGVKDVKLNLGIARGLDYYTGIVFEMHCPILGAQKQLLGGGGYDLSGVFGGQPTPTMGFGLGFDRTIVALEKEAELAGQAAAFPTEPGPSVYFGALSEKALEKVLPIVASLREKGVAVDLDLLGRKPGAMAKHADAVGARHLVIIGDRDLESGQVEVKELATGKAEKVHLQALASRFLPA